MIDVAAHGATRERTLTQEIALEGSKKRLTRRDDRGLAALQLAELLQHVEKAQQARARQLRWMLPYRALEGEELFDMMAQFRNGKPTLFEPSAEPRHLAQLVLPRVRRVAALSQRSLVVIRKRSKRPRHQDPAQPARRSGHRLLLLRRRTR